MKKLLLGLALAFAATVAVAEAISGVEIEGLKYTLDTETKTATLTGYTVSPTELNVGAITNDGETYVVTSVGDNAFDKCVSLTNVFLSQVSVVGKFAFEDCSSLKEVSLPNVITIKERVFQGCYALSSISLPSATSIERMAFVACTSLVELSLPSASMIGNQSFNGCISLTEISLPSATTIELAAFCSCSNVKRILLPRATSIAETAFANCSALETLILNVEMRKLLEWNGRGYYEISDGATIYYGLTKDQTENVKYEIVPMCGEDAVSDSAYAFACGVYDVQPIAKPQVVQEGEVAVKQTELQATKAETVTVAGGVVTLGVTVNTNGNFTAETKDWKPVELTTDNVEVKGGKIVISIPVGGDSGFMILQSGDAKVGVKSDDAAPVAPIVEAEADVENPDPEGRN